MKWYKIAKFVVFMIVVALALTGCGMIPIKLPFSLGKKAHLPWKMQQETVRPVTEIVLKNGEETAGDLRLFHELIDGFAFGSLEWRSSQGRKVTLRKCWQGTLVDAARVRWFNGDTWAFFAWDSDKPAPRRTLTIFDPRKNQLFSCEMEPGKQKKQEWIDRITYRFSWNLGFPENKPYRDFLDSVKVGYASDGGWGKKTKGLRSFRAGDVASVAWQFDDIRPPLADILTQTE